jgi:hypothetical protein
MQSFFHANQLCAQTDDPSILLHWALLRLYYLLAVTLSLNLFLYAQLTMVVDFIYSSNLQRYTIARLSAVATSIMIVSVVLAFGFLGQSIYLEYR